MDYHPSNGSMRSPYKLKLHQMQKMVKRYVILNAALCDQVSETQEQLVIAKENRRFLLERLQRIRSQLEAVSQPPNKPIILNVANNNSYPSTSQGSSHSLQDEEVNPPPKKKAKQKKPSNPKGKKAMDGAPVPAPEGPAFPLILRGLTVHSLGTPKDYETHMVRGLECLIPTDYHATRIYGRLSDPETRCPFECRVINTLIAPRQFCSRFEVSCCDLEQPISCETADDCHASLIEMINNAMGAEVVTQQPKGDWFFGFALPAVSRLMKTSYTFRPTDALGCDIDEENDDSLHFEALQRSIAIARFEAQSGNVTEIDTAGVAMFSRSAEMIPVSEEWEV